VAAPGTVDFGAITTQAPAPTAQPVTYSGDCVYVARSGLYQYQLTIDINTPTPTPTPATIVDNLQFYSVTSTTSPTPNTVSSNVYTLPITKDGTTNGYHGSFSHTYYCGGDACLLATKINTPSASVNVEGFRTSLSVTALRMN
jgi:hypothetical protein